jgi:GxxExxY protein
VSEKVEEKPFWNLTSQIIGAAFEVHKALGSGFLEKVYVRALLRELADAGLTAESEVAIPVLYKGTDVGFYYADLVVERTVVCEIKAVASLAREHEAQLIHYLTATNTKVGLLLNFGSKSVQLKRMIL